MLQGGGKQDFEVGSEVRVQCTSFNSKGIPVMSIVQDDQSDDMKIA